MPVESAVEYVFNPEVSGVVHSDDRAEIAVPATKCWLGSVECTCSRIECEEAHLLVLAVWSVEFVKFSPRV
jgi:hypothetical protein